MEYNVENEGILIKKKRKSKLKFALMGEKKIHLCSLIVSDKTCCLICPALKAAVGTHLFLLGALSCVGK